MNTMTSTLYLCAPLMLALALCSTQATAPTNSTTTSTPWLKKKQKPPHGSPPGEQDCWYRPWICRDSDSEWPFGRRRMKCCMNRCVAVRSDPDNCGLCGVRCMSGRQCCRGFCVKITRNPFHCGGCFHRCPHGSSCLHGHCDYPHPLHPKPLNPPHKPPFQPEPPSHPKPPKAVPPSHHKPPLHHKPPKPEPSFHHKPPKDPSGPPKDTNRTARHLHSY